MADHPELSRAAFAETLDRQGLSVPEERFDDVYAAARAIDRAMAPLRRRDRMLPVAPLALPLFGDEA